MATKQTWAWVPLKPNRELEFYLRLARLVDAPTRPTEVTELLDCLAVPTAEELAGQRPIQTALKQAEHRLRDLWNQLDASRDQAEGYGHVATSSLEEFVGSPFGQLCVWCLVDLGYFDKVEVELSEFVLLLSNARMMLRLPSISTGGMADQQLIPEVLSAMVGEQLRAERAAAGIVEHTQENPLAYIESGGRYRPIPLAQLPLVGAERVLLIDPVQQSTTFYQRNAEGTATTYWYAEQYLAQVSDEGQLDLGDWSRYKTLIVKHAPQQIGMQITEQMRALWAIVKRRIGLLLESQKSKMAQVDWQHWHARVLLDCLMKYNPPLTKHVRYVTTGYALAALGLIESEDEYLDSDRKSSYREFLRTKVQALDAR